MYLFRLARVHPAGSMKRSWRLNQRKVLQMKRLAYLLILLLISAQVDDTWAVAPVVLSAPLADEDDEYLPSQRVTRGEESYSRQKPVLDAVNPRNADFPFAPGSVPSKWILTTPFAPLSLYVFMSLQI